MNKYLILIIILSSLSACNTPQIKRSHNLEPGAIEKIKHLNTYLIFEQENILANIMNSGHTTKSGSGILFTLNDVAIRNSQVENAENSVSLLREHLKEFEYADLIKQKLIVESSKHNSIIDKNIKISRKGIKQIYKEIMNTSKADAVLFIITKYKVSLDFSSIKTTVEAFMFSNKKSLDSYKEIDIDHNKPLHFGDNIYHKKIIASSVIATSYDMNQNVKIVSSSLDDIDVALEENAVFIAKQLVNDFIGDVQYSKLSH